ncbi:hypothetical protein CRG98_006209 [Punica granatum]|uniref:Uncharacterized protein n=1 Tax=Punica granatum TaxID=22663 RepID=A0A2I0KXS3_PUNGR|nr:hypothetical protein CRG98_006209 [Punica granatum]
MKRCFYPFLPSVLQYPITPWALQGVLEYFKQKYGNPPMYIHESGQRMQRNSTLEDLPRVTCLQDYIGAVLDSLGNGSDTKGYFTWSFLDVFEVLDGYSSGYGLYYVDLDDPGLTRYPKLSAKWYSHFLRGGSVGPDSGSIIDITRENLTSVSPDEALIE